MTEENEELGQVEEEELGYDPTDYNLEPLQQRKTQEDAAYRAQADKLWAKAKGLGVPVTNPAMQDVLDHLATGNIERAQTKIDRLGKAVEANISKEAERRVQEKLKTMEDTGQLVSETGDGIVGNTAGMSDEKWFTEVYGQNGHQPTTEDFERARKHMEWQNSHPDAPPQNTISDVRVGR